MAERRPRGRAGRGEPTFRDEEFTPVATVVLTIIYIMIFASLWGLVYYFELLARR
jgi:hypothetical protein